jgi:hypothetical protein
MTEQEWLASSVPDDLLMHLTPATSDRKLRLFACACCRRIWDLLPQGAGRQAVEMSESFADGDVRAEDLYRSWLAAKTLVADDEARVGAWNRLIAAEVEARDAARSRAWSAARTVVADADRQERQAQCDLLRDIFNPFHVPAPPGSWLSNEAKELCDQIYQERAFDRMPILADNLEKGGCPDTGLLAHCRGRAAHVRGCWAIDLLTGRK